MPKGDKKLTVIRLAAVILLVTAVVLIIFMFLRSIMPGLIEAIQSGREDAIEEYLRSSDRFIGILSLFLLQYIQILSIFLPGAPIQIASGIVFGPWMGFLACYFGYVLANLTLFVLCRKLGDKISLIISDNRQRDDSRLEQIMASPAIGVVILCLVPIVPNGLVPVFASRTSISFKRFLVSVVFGCIPTLFILAGIGNHLLVGDYLISIILCSILGSIAVLVYLYRNQIIEAVSAFETWLRSKLNKQ